MCLASFGPVIVIANLLPVIASQGLSLSSPSPSPVVAVIGAAMS